MNNMNTQTNTMGDKEVVNDCIISQKQISSSYNTYAGECVSEPLRNAFLSILDDEHRIQAGLFKDMQSRGWYNVDPAESNKLQQVKQKFPTQ